MVHRNRRKRLKVSSQFTDDSSDDVAEFDDHCHSSDSDFHTSVAKENPKNDPPALPFSHGLSQTWSAKYALITNQTRLVTSTRKSKEVSTWLRGALLHSRPRMLILMGPPGSGKTSTLKAAAMELRCAVATWQAPATGQRSITMTLLDDFQSFFIGTRYCPLHCEKDEDGAEGAEKGHKLLLIDDLPVTTSDSVQKRERLQRIFSDASRFAPYPTVLIVSDSEKAIARTISSVLGYTFLSSPKIETIKVPAVTEATMIRTLRGVLRKEGISVSRHQLDGTIAASNGDVRAALNTLQFCVGKGSKKEVQLGDSQINVPRDRKRKRVRSSIPATKQSFRALPKVAQDATLGTYHAVSKILNNKRREDGGSMYVAEEILEDAKADPPSFLAFLHHNYPAYFGDINDVVPALNCLCDADCLLPWIQDDLQRTLLGECAASVATRGFLIHNSNPIRTGWRPVKGPESYAVAKEGKERAAIAQRQFSKVLSPAVFTTTTMCEIVPFAEKITGTKLREWSLTGTDSGCATAPAVDCAGMEMVDMVVCDGGKVHCANSSSRILDEESGDQDEYMEEIEEWDD